MLEAVLRCSWYSVAAVGTVLQLVQHCSLYGIAVGAALHSVQRCIQCGVAFSPALQSVLLCGRCGFAVGAALQSVRRCGRCGVSASVLLKSVRFGRRSASASGTANSSSIKTYLILANPYNSLEKLHIFLKCNIVI